MRFPPRHSLSRPPIQGRAWLIAGAVMVVLAAGCGDEPSSPVAVRVGTTTITKADIDQAQRVTLAGTNQDPDGWGPPTYRSCIAASTKGVADPPSRAALMQGCRAQYRQARTDAARLLIRSAWAEADAARKGIDVSAAAIRRSLARAARDDLDEARRQARLRRFGMTAEDLVPRMRASRIQTALERATPVSARAIAAWYRSYPVEFAKLEVRTLRYVLAGSHKRARAARAALAAGDDWESVHAMYGKPGSGSRLTFVQDTLGKSGAGRDVGFFDAAFEAREHAVTGPVKGKLGWYVLELAHRQPGVRPPLGKVAGQIERTLQARKFSRLLEDRYARATHCAPAYRVAELPECRASRAAP